jgi:hypothetical protein
VGTQNLINQNFSLLHIYTINFSAQIKNKIIKKAGRVLNVKTFFPIALFNGTVATTNGIYSIKDIEIAAARSYIEDNDFISAIGHEATAEIMSELLGKKIPMNRIQFHQQIGQIAIVFKLNTRPPEGIILNKKQMEKIGYCLKIMERLE